jgi:hypothetical protein
MGGLFIFFGCKQKEENFFNNIPVKGAKNNFFESIDSVRLISFPSKMHWAKDEIISGDEVEFEIPEDKIIDDVILIKADFNKIKDIFNDEYNDGCIVADCYEPRHIFKFYKNGEIIGFYEICLDCGGHQNSKNLDFLPPFCIQKGEEIKKIFKKIGLKNYGEGSPILNQLER